MATAEMVNVTRIIDDGRVSGLQYAAIFMCSLVAFLDGVDSQSIALGAPVIVDMMHLARTSLGPIFSAGLFGATLGALTFGPLGDRFGRKRMLVVAALIIGVFTLMTAYAETYSALLAIRFAAGIGLGGATPCFIALASEYAPLRRRAAVASLIWAAFPLGGAAGGFLNGYILGHYDWQTMFLFGGVAPILVAIVLTVWLPESIRFLLASGLHAERIGAIVSRIRPGTPLAARYVADEERAHGVPLLQLFAGARARTTLLLWVPFFTAFGILGITVVWTPVLMRDHGLPLAAAGMVLGVHNIGALIGMGTAGRLMERFGTIPILCPALLLGGVMVAALGYAAASTTTMAIDLALIGLCVGAGGSGSIALASMIYPTAIRSTGIGWAMGLGRFGQVLTPLIASGFMSGGYSGEQLFLFLGIAPIVGGLAVLALRAQRVPAALSQAS